MKLLPFSALLAASSIAFAAPAMAVTTIPFSFLADGGSPFVGSADGSGSFTSSLDTGVVSLGTTLTAFTLSGTAGAFVPALSSSYSFGLADLTSFSATLANGQVTAFSFATTEKTFDVTLNYGVLKPQGDTTIQISANGIGPDNVAVTNGLTSAVVGAVPGTLTFDNAAAVPEPASWALAIGGIGLVGAAMRRTGRKATRRASAVA